MFEFGITKLSISIILKTHNSSVFSLIPTNVVKNRKRYIYSTG